MVSAANFYRSRTLKHGKVTDDEIFRRSTFRQCEPSLVYEIPFRGGGGHCSRIYRSLSDRMVLFQGCTPPPQKKPWSAPPRKTMVLLPPQKKHTCHGFICVITWFYLGVHGFIRGGHACFFWRGHAWFFPCMVFSGEWFFWGVHGFFSFFGYNEIRSMSERYASYWKLKLTRIS